MSMSLLGIRVLLFILFYMLPLGSAAALYRALGVAALARHLRHALRRSTAAPFASKAITGPGRGRTPTPSSPPSGPGFRLTLGGYAGPTFARVEGIEVDVLGAIARLGLRRPAIELPGFAGSACAGRTDRRR